MLVQATNRRDSSLNCYIYTVSSAFTSVSVKKKELKYTPILLAYPSLVF